MGCKIRHEEGHTLQRKIIYKRRELTKHKVSLNDENPNGQPFGADMEHCGGEGSREIRLKQQAEARSRRTLFHDKVFRFCPIYFSESIKDFMEGCVITKLLQKARKLQVIFGEKGQNN